MSRQKKRITPAADTSTMEPSPPLLPSQQEFHAYLRSLAQRAVRTLREAVMREELDAFMGVTWGAWSPKRKGKRLGTSTRDLVTSAGRLEDIKVPRDREGQFHTQAFERDTRSEPHNVEGRDGMFACRDEHPTSVGEVAQALLGVASSAISSGSSPSGASARGLEHWRILYLDGIHFEVRHGDQADSTMILTAL